MVTKKSISFHKGTLRNYLVDDNFSEYNIGWKTDRGEIYIVNGPPKSIEVFYDNNKFPQKYKNSIFIALHGSWNRTKKSGYKIVFIKLDEEGNYMYHEDFITGWLVNENAWGRPVSPFIMTDGSMLISDDKANIIYRVTYSS